MALGNLELELWMAKRLGHSRHMSRNVSTCYNTKPKATCQLMSAREHRVTSKQRERGESCHNVNQDLLESTLESNIVTLLPCPRPKAQILIASSHSPNLIPSNSRLVA